MEDQKQDQPSTQKDSTRFWKTPNTLDSRPELLDEEVEKSREKAERKKSQERKA